MDNRTHPLETLTHLDGRNSHKIESLRNYFSEIGWMRYRLRVMVAYLNFLVSKKIISTKVIIPLNLITTFGITEGIGVWKIEKVTNHDLKALEIFLKDLLRKRNLSALSPFVNLGIGSEDINNVALRLQVRDAFDKVLLPEAEQLLKNLIEYTEPLVTLPMLARTHGQPAAATTLGKELALFIFQLFRQLNSMKKLAFTPKFSGEVGNLSTLKSLFPQHDWLLLEREFLSTLGFSDVSYATQIPSYFDLIEFFDALKRLNLVLIGLTKDIWLYASFGYFKLANMRGEAGSAGMPHKINPQYFEGAEGGLEMANALLEFFSRKFSYNRLQRDFSDSTVRRNICLPFAYSILSYQSIQTGLRRIKVNKGALTKELDTHWEILSEILTTSLKFEGKDDAYDIVRDRMRGRVIDKTAWLAILRGLPLKNSTKIRLEKIKPALVVGVSVEITNRIIKEVKEKNLKKKDSHD